MVEKIAVNVVGQMMGEQLINKELREQYIYAFISLVEKLLTVGTIILLSVVTNKFVPTVFFLLFFLSLRKRTGGFHLNTFGQCYLATVTNYIVVISIGSAVADNCPVLLGTLAVSICIIIAIGTVNHPNVHMNVMELTESKKAARMLAVLEGGIIYFLALVGVDMVFISYMSIAVILCAALLCLAKIIKQEVKEDEENQQKSIKGC